MGETNEPQVAQANGPIYECFGEIIVGPGINLKLVSAALFHGHFRVRPSAVLAGPTSSRWEAQHDVGTTRGVQGGLQYQVSEDAIVHVHFTVPWIGNNDAYFFVSGRQSDLIEVSVSTVPKNGYKISPTFVIKKKGVSAES